MQSYILLLRGECSDSSFQYQPGIASPGGDKSSDELLSVPRSSSTHHKSPNSFHHNVQRPPRRSYRLQSMPSRRVPVTTQSPNTSTDDVEERLEHSHIYFAKRVLQFGTVSVGSLKRMTIVICNATEHEVYNIFIIYSIRLTCA